MKAKNSVMTVAITLLLLAGFTYATAYYIMPLYRNYQLEAGSFTNIKFVIYYADGSQQVIETPNKLEVYTATLSSGGRKITGIVVSTDITLDTGGRTVSGWNSTVSRRMEIYKVGVSAPLTSSTANYPASGSNWADGEKKTAIISQIGTLMIEGAVEQYGSGTYTIQVVDNVQLSVTCSDGTSSMLAGTGTATLTIEYLGYSAMSITVTTAITPLIQSTGQYPIQ